MSKKPLPMLEAGVADRQFGKPAYEQWMLIAQQNNPQYTINWAMVTEQQKYAWSAAAKIVLMQNVEAYALLEARYRESRRREEELRAEVGQCKISLAQKAKIIADHESSRKSKKRNKQ